MYLMLGDIIVAKSNNTLGIWTEIKEELLPLGMKLVDIDKILIRELDELKVSNPNMSQMDMIQKALEVTTRHTERNISNMQEWLSLRVLPMARANAKMILNNLGLHQGDDLSTKSKTAIRFNAVSITDNYWLKPTDSDIKWESLDPKRIKLSEGFATLALTGKLNHIEAISTWDDFNDNQAGVETSAIGTYAKGCFRKEDGLYMLKTGNELSVVAEWLSSQILSCTNVYSYVSYGIDEGDGALGFPVTGIKSCYSKIMTTSDRNVVMAMQMWETAEAYARVRFPKQFAQIAVVDYLIGNSDRHPGNWGFFREAPEWKVTGLHSIYDNNYAFKPATYFNYKDTDKSSIVDRGTKQAKSLREGALEMKEIAGLKFTKQVDPEWFDKLPYKQNEYREEFVKRCMEMGMGNPFKKKSILKNTDK